MLDNFQMNPLHLCLRGSKEGGPVVGGGKDAGLTRTFKFTDLKVQYYRKLWLSITILSP